MSAPEGSIYEGYNLKVELTWPDEYPLKPPIFEFRTPVYHPNIDWNSGKPCIDILLDRWSPALTIGGPLHCVRTLFACPTPHGSVVNVEAAEHWQRDEDGAIQKAKEMI